MTHPQPFDQFLDHFRTTCHDSYRRRGDIDKLSMQRGLPPFMLREVMACNPLSVNIPLEYGGRGAKTDEILALLSAASYESLALSLTLGINSALFLQPLAKYGTDEARNLVFRRFLEQQNMGGLMITEPGHGSDALNMQTSFRPVDDGFLIQGTKHWAGLTGWADFWLLTAREQIREGELGRDIGFFICDVSQAEQHIEVEEFFDNLGLYQIPYGRNRIDVKVPELFRLQPHSTGIKLMLDLLHRSRLQFPGMALGFIHRMFDEAMIHTRERAVAGKKLIELDQVQHRLSELQSSYTIASAMCATSSKTAGIDKDLTTASVQANSVKSYVTDLMQQAAQSLVQMVGAKAYRLSHIGGRGITDSRPFQIFEGSNDMLYAQISEAFTKQMKSLRLANLKDYLKQHHLTTKSSDRIGRLFDFDLKSELTQRKLVDLGKVISRIVSMEMVIDLGENGFRKDLIDNCLDHLTNDIMTLLGVFHLPAQVAVVEDYKDNSQWFGR
ncbi:MAG: acyl-CoA dehydrogenase family protein [Marinilabiliales bacterium]|nr:acyl-CoA dehydrogenase family protein [Marinilabiliales bacterium]